MFKQKELYKLLGKRKRLESTHDGNSWADFKKTCLVLALACYLLEQELADFF